MKGRLLTGFVALSLVAWVSACGGEQRDGQMLAASEVANIATSKVTRSSITDHYEASGTVRANTTTDVSANLLGRINSITVSEGDLVKRGQPLIEIDNREARSQLQQAEAAKKEAEATLIEIDKNIVAANAAVRTAEANRQLANVTFGRYKELYQRKSISGQEFDDASSKLQAASAEVDRAKATVEAIRSKKAQANARIEQANAEIARSRVQAGYAMIVSPVSGVVVKKLAENGAMASPGVPLLSIEDNSRYRLEVAVEESRSGLVRIGRPVTVKIDAVSEGEFIGTVAEVLPSADTSSRTFTVKIDLPANPNLRSGQYGLARFETGQTDAITVPDAAVIERGQLTGVIVVRPDGFAQFRIVTIGKRAEGQAEILSGLSEGEEVVTSGAASVKDGSKVR